MAAQVKQVAFGNIDIAAEQCFQLAVCRLKGRLSFKTDVFGAIEPPKTARRSL